MFLHVAFPWLLGPLWNSWANTHRARWYGRGVLAMLLGGAILLAWALPAGFSGGEAYRQRLFFTQTAGRVVDAFDHARPFWWYLPMIPALLFPFSGWPRAWVALGTLRRPLEPGIRFGLCWLLPILLAFSLISGKQLYYPLPEFAGAALLLAGAIAVLREKRPALANTPWLGTWPLGVGGLLFAVFLFVLPNLVAHNLLHGEFIDATSQYSRFFSVVFVVLGALLLLRGRGELRRLAVAGLVGTLALNTLFTLTMWPNFDLRPAAQLLGAADAEGRAIGYLGNYEGQFHFEGRITRPIERLSEGDSVQAFARAHPDGLIIARPEKLDAADLRYPLLVQPFRSSWVVIWPAASLAAHRAGRTPPEPPHPTRIYQVDAWRYRALQ
jgi:4-amino-4-deoxy-L-arabinose transferase-like glycosyltransferase